MPHEDLVTRYDPFDPLVHADPYPFYKALRDVAPLHHVAADLWTLSRYDDVVAASRDWKTFSYARSVDLDDTGLRLGRGNFLACDPPQHTSLRTIVQHAFRPKVVHARLHDTIKREVEAGLDCLAESSECDIAEVLAWNVAMRAASALLGFPLGDCETLREVADRCLWRRLADINTSDADVAEAGIDAVREYFVDKIKERRTRPADDLLSEIAAAIPGRAGGNDTAAGLAGLLFLGAVDTSAVLISTSLWLLHEHPRQRAHLARNRDRIPTAVEEILRYESPIQFFKRTVMEDVVLHGEQVPSGARLLLLYGSANRDERRFATPDEFDVERKPGRHLAFGDGIHHCLGAPVARLEARIALEALLARFPAYHVTRTPEWLERPNGRGVTSLVISAH